METWEILLLISAAFAGGIASYPTLATQNGWPMGTIYASKSSAWGLIYLGVMAFSLAYIGARAYSDKASWLMLVWFIGTTFVGAPFVSLVFGRLTGIVSIVGALGFLGLTVLIA